MAFHVGDTIGDYEIIGLLGSGGMGRVYRVRNVISDRVEALKILLPDLSDQPELGDRFIREIKLQASLVHPNIAALHTALRVNNQLLMLMELIEGETLEKKLTEGPIELWKAKEYIVQVLGALSYAHGRGIIHRDLKPANMMITPADTIKLMDFGIAKGATDHQLTQTGTALGSLYYMSPEQVKGKQPDARSDLYSLGIVFYELATGKRPYQGDSDYAIMTAHLMEDPRPPIELNPAVPKEVSDAILRAIKKDPAERYQSAEEFHVELTGIRTGTKAMPAVAPPAMGEPAKPHGNRKAIAGVVAFGVLLAALVFSRAFDSKKTDTPEVASGKPAPRVEVLHPSPGGQTSAAVPPPVAPVQPEPVKPALQQPSRKADTTVVAQTPAKAPATVTSAPVAPPPVAAPPVEPPVQRVTPPVTQPKPAAVAPAQPDPRAVAEAEWIKIASTQDVSVLKDFRRRHPDTPPAQQALARIEQIEWDAARASRDLKALRAFRAEYPSSPRAPQAAAEIERIEREAAVRGVLDTIERYRAANERLDVEGIRAVWPGRGQALLDRIAESFRNTRAMRLSLQPTGEPQISGDTATVVLRRNLSVELKNGPRPRPVEGQVTARLQRAGSGWVIVSLE